MSLANMCDRCGVLYQSEPGCITVESLRVETPNGETAGWVEIDFCVTCSRELLSVLRPAMVDLPEGL